MTPLLAAWILLGTQDPGSGHTKDSLDVVKAKVAAKDALIVDVREKGEWEDGHLEGALFVPLSWLREGAKDQNFAERLAEKIPAKKILYTHCRSGKRTLIAAGILRTYGYDVRPLKQGFDELREAGFPPAAPDR
jgi:phage shock protein E